MPLVTPSKMQVIIDRAEVGLETADPGSQTAFRALIDAVKLLAQANAQIMGDLSDLQRYRMDIPIGGDRSVIKS